MSPSLHLHLRRLANITALSFCWAAALFGLFLLGMILLALVRMGMAGLNLAVFTQMTPPPNQVGGLLNALFGSVLLTGLGILVGTPVGLLAGTYLAEYARDARLASLVRLVNEVLLSAPSIVIGLFIYQVVVVPMGHFSVIAGAAALALIVVPIVARTTESALILVPQSLRESAAALGLSSFHVIRHVIYRAARAGITTGILLAVARISGETAPLLFTSLNNQFWSAGVGGPIASLPIVIFQFALSPYANWQHLAWTAGLLIAFLVLTLNIWARLMDPSGERT